MRVAVLVALTSTVVGCSASTPSATTSSAATTSSVPTAVATQPLTPTAIDMRSHVVPVLTTYGWAVVSASQPVTPAGAQLTELDLVIRKSSGASGSAWVADGTTSTLALVRYDSSADEPGLYNKRCTATTCTVRLDSPSCPYAIDCRIGGQATPGATADGLARGSLITWATGILSGIGAESVIGTDPTKPDAPVAVLPDQAGYDLVRAIAPPAKNEAAGVVSGIVRGYGGPASTDKPGGAQTGQPLSRQDVTFVDAQGNQITVTAGTDGRYSASLKPGTYTMLCGVQPQVDVSAGKSVTLDCDMTIP
jgi:hypothetical protein